MAGTLTKKHFIHLSDRLRRNTALAAKAFELEDRLNRVFGENERIDIDGRNQALTVKVGLPGHGECTRTIMEGNLVESIWLDNLFQEMKEALTILRTYLREVGALFQHIQTWLRRDLPNNRIEEVPLKVFEEFTGEYTTKKLVIHQGKRSVEIRPKGAWWITTQGRVDLLGKDQEQTLIFSRPEGGWLLVQEYPKVALIPLQGELLIQLVKQLLE